MSDTVDYRVKIPVEDGVVIRAIAHARDVDQTEVVRQIICEYCRSRIHEARVLASLAASEGITVADRRRSGRGI